MVRQNTHKTQIFSGLVALAVSVFVFSILSPVATKATDQNTTFKVNVSETLTVSLVTPDTWASGNMTYNSTLGRWVSGLLRNEVQLNVSSNNSDGFTASMTSDSTTSAALANTATSLTSDTIPTLTSGTTWTRSNTDTTLFWGYSTDDDSETGTYSGIPLQGATPATLLSSQNQGSGSANIYFGAMADSTVASGTYEGTVIISVVSGVVTTPSDNPNNNPITPTDPATPNDTTTNNPTYVYDNANNRDRTVYTETATDATNHTSTNTTIISQGDTTESYANPRGVTSISEGTPLATGLAVTAGIAATTGIFFFILAKRRDDDDEDE